LRLWSFIFTFPEAPIRSARIAAHGRAQARLVLQALIPDRDVYADLRGKSPALIEQPMGEVSVKEPGLVSVIQRDGQMVMA
jgi:hypothetical protein